MDLVSKFFYGEDERIDKLDDYEIPAEWWSRPHEYAWATKFLKHGETILDAGCGVGHPFKFYAANRVDKVIAIDKDPAVKAIETPENIETICADICNLKEHVTDNSVDKVFCISVLEHLYPVNILDALKEFKRVLKSDGQIILTLDYPILQPETLINLVDAVGLSFVGSVDYNFDKHKVIKGSYGNLKCYRAILCKPEAETAPEPEETKPIAPKEKKPIKPKKTK